MKRVAAETPSRMRTVRWTGQAERQVSLPAWPCGSGALIPEKRRRCAGGERSSRRSRGEEGAVQRGGYSAAAAKGQQTRVKIGSAHV